MNDMPVGFVPLMKDTTLPHQIGFVHAVGMNGSGVKVSCNCGWKSARTLEISDPKDHLILYNSHLQ
jgi:hypothetical protein